MKKQYLSVVIRESQIIHSSFLSTQADTAYNQ